MGSILDSYPEYSQTSRLDELRATEYGYLDEQGHLYLDFTGAGLAAKSQIRAHESRLGQTLFGNPHSTNPTSQSATRLVEDARARVLDYLNASPKEYTAIFTANATGAARLVAEAYPFKRRTNLVLTSDNHNSVNGLREFARRSHAKTVYVPVRAPELRVDPSDLMSALSRRRGETLLVTQLDALKEIFQSKANAFMKPEITRRIQTPVMGNGIVFTEGEEHRADRRLFSPPFSLNKIKRLIPMIQYMAKQLNQHLSQLTEQQPAIIDISSMWSRVTLDVIAYYSTGTDMSITLKPSVFHDSYQDVFDPSTFGQLLMLISGFFPAVRLIPFKENRKFNSARERIRSEIRKIIRQRMSELSEESAKDVEKPDLLSHMISESRATGQLWPEEKLFENVLNLFGAGHETSATTLVWTIHALTLHTDIQDRLRADVLNLLERKPNPDFVDLESLPYLDKVLKESLRLYNPGIATGREPMHDVEVCGILIPKGTMIMCMPSILNQNPAIWGPDVDEFKPERWDNLTGQAADPNAMASFLLGPRSCIGKAFSMLEMKILLVEVLSKFRFEAVVDEKDMVLMNPSLTLRIQGGLKARVTRL
ncbi:cytochrome P450 [Colletotrichum karsti]|uniref:Cytochrome P450 n=1 Tax=Colletotrichum karsti TaxID=1095194 RepID=A0A9P6I9I8_9PEZI|nr:cytochrome P450 [Colletotrichum karsti]KAF9878823.1 cytochrome P450 [Colletotrichum karsti]